MAVGSSCPVVESRLSQAHARGCHSCLAPCSLSSLCLTRAKHHARGFICVPFIHAASEHGGLHGAQRRPSSLVLDAARQCPTLGLSHCKQARPCHAACSDFWPLKQYSLLKCGQCCKCLPWAFFPDIHGMEWAAGVCSQLPGAPPL